MVARVYLLSSRANLSQQALDQQHPTAPRLSLDASVDISARSRSGDPVRQEPVREYRGVPSLFIGSQARPAPLRRHPKSRISMLGLQSSACPVEPTAGLFELTCCLPAAFATSPQGGIAGSSVWGSPFYSRKPKQSRIL